MTTIIKTARYVVALVAVMGLVASCTVDPERQSKRMPTEAEIEQYNASVEPEDRIICRNEKPFGSRITQRVCRRSGKIDEISDLSQREWRRITLTNN